MLKLVSDCYLREPSSALISGRSVTVRGDYAKYPHAGQSHDSEIWNGEALRREWDPFYYLTVSNIENCR